MLSAKGKCRSIALVPTFLGYSPGFPHSQPPLTVMMAGVKQTNKVLKKELEDVKTHCHGMSPEPAKTLTYHHEEEDQSGPNWSGEFKGLHCCA